MGSGLSGRLATRIKGLLTERRDPPVPDVPPPLNRRPLRWVEPQLVVEVEFLNWTGDGRLRNPVFRGIRNDKSVAEAHGDG